MVVAVEVVSVGSQAGVERKAEVGSGMVSGVVEAVAAGHGGGGDGGGGGERRRGGHGRRRAEFRKRQVVPTSHFVAETAPEESIYHAHPKEQTSKTNTGTDRYENGT